MILEDELVTGFYRDKQTCFKIFFICFKVFWKTKNAPCCKCNKTGTNLIRSTNGCTCSGTVNFLDIFVSHYPAAFDPKAEAESFITFLRPGIKRLQYKKTTYTADNKPFHNW